MKNFKKRLLAALVIGISVFFLFSYMDKSWVVAKGATPSLEMDIKEVENKDGIPGIQVNFFVKGKLKNVWKWLRDVDHLSKLFLSLEKIVKVKDIDSNTILWEYNLDTALGKKIFNVRRSVDDRNYSVKWIRTEGDLQYYGGSWKLKASKEYPGWVDCIYTNFINAAWYVPYWKVKSTSKDNAEAMVPTLRNMVAGKK